MKEERIIHGLLLRIRTDWKEYWWHYWHMDSLRRDRKRILRAISVAKEKNAIDGRTYYILRSPSGAPGAYNSNDVKYLRHVGIIPKEIKYEKMLESALAVVTSNEIKYNYYVQVQSKKEEIDE